MKKIISWNVASVRARMDTLKQLLQNEKPDIVFLQELKCDFNSFPFFEINMAPYLVVLIKKWTSSLHIPCLNVLMIDTVHIVLFSLKR